MQMQKALNNLQGTSIGAVLICRGFKANPSSIEKDIVQLGFQKNPSVRTDPCNIYLPKRQTLKTHYLNREDWNGEGVWELKEIERKLDNIPSTYYVYSSNVDNSKNRSVLYTKSFALEGLEFISIPIMAGTPNGFEINIVNTENQMRVFSLDKSTVPKSWFEWLITAESLPKSGRASIIVKDTGANPDQWISVGMPRFIYTD
jgi:hypothetical protein